MRKVIASVSYEMILDADYRLQGYRSQVAISANFDHYIITHALTLSAVEGRRAEVDNIY